MRTLLVIILLLLNAGHVYGQTKKPTGRKKATTNEAHVAVIKAQIDAAIDSFKAWNNLNKRKFGEAMITIGWKSSLSVSLLAGKTGVEGVKDRLRLARLAKVKFDQQLNNNAEKLAALIREMSLTKAEQDELIKVVKTSDEESNPSPTSLTAIMEHGFDVVGEYISLIEEQKGKWSIIRDSLFFDNDAAIKKYSQLVNRFQKINGEWSIPTPEKRVVKESYERFLARQDAIGQQYRAKSINFVSLFKASRLEADSNFSQGWEMIYQMRRSRIDLDKGFDSLYRAYEDTIQTLDISKASKQKMLEEFRMLSVKARQSTDSISMMERQIFDIAERALKELYVKREAWFVDNEVLMFKTDELLNSQKAAKESVLNLQKKIDLVTKRMRLQNEVYLKEWRESMSQ